MSYVRVSILGTTVGGEKWSVNPVFDPTGEFPGGVSQSALDAATLAIANITVPTNLLTLMSTALSITGARSEVRDDSTDELIGLSEQGRPAPLAGVGTIRMGAQNAVVCSLRTDTPGARGRGRIYWPALGATLGTNLRLSAPTNAATVNSFAIYFNAMRTALAAAFPTIGFDLAVRSRTAHTTPHVNRIQVGDVIDTQRRRRDTFVESYAVATFP